MTHENVHLSIILPVYNAADFLVQSLDVLNNFIMQMSCSAELLLVDDGSKDASLKIANEWAKRGRSYKVRVLACEKNLGKGGAVALGMLKASGKYRIFLDIDLAYPPSQILRILEALEDGSDVAVACRVHPDSRYTISPAFFHYLYTRHLASRVINWAMRHTIIPGCRDSQAGLKGFSSKAAEQIFSRQIIYGFSFDVEALYLAEKLGFSIREVAVEYRYFNEPTTVVFVQDGMSLMRDVFRVRFHHMLGRYKLPAKDKLRRVIINADDYGMTFKISRGILKAVEAQAVSSTSAMTNSADFDMSMDEIASAQKHPNVGFHAVLTWGRPISDPKDIPSLVDCRGMFFSKGVLLARSMLGKISAEEVYKELRAQCEKLKKRWPEISHLNGHHHVHVFPVVCKAVEKVAHEFGIRVIRAPYEGFWSPWYHAFLKRWFIAILSASRPAYWRHRGFVCADNFGGFSLGAGRNLKTRWENTFVKLKNGTTEIMVHPGYVSEKCDSYNEERENELDFLCSADFIQLLKEFDVNLASFKGAAGK